MRISRAQFRFLPDFALFFGQRFLMSVNRRAKGQAENQEAKKATHKINSPRKSKLKFPFSAANEPRFYGLWRSVDTLWA